MANHATLNIIPDVWIPITTNSVAEVRLQNESVFDIELQATMAGVRPTSAAGSLRIAPKEVLVSPLLPLFSGVGVGPYYLWVRSKSAGVVSVSHADGGAALPSFVITNPVISGQPFVGETLTITTGTWSGIPTSFRAVLSNAAVPTGTGPWTYVIPPSAFGLSLSANVTANSAIGLSNVAISNSTSPISVYPLVNTTAPFITGTPLETQVLVANTGVWSGTPTLFGLQWFRSNTAIVAASNTSYTLTGDDVGSQITVAVTASKSLAANVTAFSAATVTIAATAISNILLPQITGSLELSQVLSVSEGTWLGTPALISYQWLRNEVPISGATANTYTIALADIGSRISVSATASKSGTSSVTVTTAQTAIITNSPQVTQGSVSFLYSGTTVATASSFDGSAVIVLPDSGTISILDVIPERSLAVPINTVISAGPPQVIEPRPYDLSGVQRNPSRARNPFDSRLGLRYDGTTNLAFPATLAVNDKIMKYISNTSIAPDSQSVRNGIASEIATLNVIDQTRYNSMQANGGISSWLSPTPISWSGRSQHVWRKMDMDALFASRPTLNFTTITPPTAVSLTEIVSRLSRFNPGLLATNDTTGVGYEAHCLNSYGVAGTGNYGGRMAQIFRYIAMQFIGGAPRATIEPAIRRLAEIGSWWFDLEEGGGTNQAPDGGHWQIMLIPMLLGLMATGRANRIPDIPSVSRCNQFGQSRLLSAGDLALLVPHTNNSGPFAYRHRPVHAISGANITVGVVSNVDPYWSTFNGLECRKASDNSLLGYVLGPASAIATGSDNNFRGIVTLDRTVSNLTTSDLVYFAAPSGWLEVGTPVWTINGTMTGYTPSPEARYIELNHWAGDVFFIRAMGLYNNSFEAMEKLVKSWVYSPTLPSPQIGAGGSIPNNDAFGLGIYNPSINQWIKNIWDLHASSVGLSETPIWEITATNDGAVINNYPGDYTPAWSLTPIPNGVTINIYPGAL